MADTPPGADSARNSTIAARDDGTRDSRDAVSGHNECEDWSDHVIVCGLQGVGLRTVEQLRVTDVAVVVIEDEHDGRMASLVESWGCPHMSSDGDPSELLR